MSTDRVRISTAMTRPRTCTGPGTVRGAAADASGLDGPVPDAEGLEPDVAQPVPNRVQSAMLRASDGRVIKGGAGGEPDGSESRPYLLDTPAGYGICGMTGLLA